MATGITKRHSARCRSRGGGRCNCGAGYEAWVYLPREGRKVSKTFAREAEARSWRASKLVAASRGALRAQRRDVRTVAEALTAFVDGMEAGTVRPRNRASYKPNTVRAYERAVRNHIAPAPIGSLKLADVRRADVQEFADELLAAGLAPGSVSNVLNPIQAFYRRAIERDELTVNPAERLDIPTGGDFRPRRIASAAEAAALLAALPDTERPLWATAFYSGLRRGELQALRCVDVDLARSLIRVERSWDQVEGALDPKSASSRRTVPLLAILRDHLDEHLLRVGRSGEDLVFGRSPTLPFAPMTVAKRAARAWVAPLEPITLHECRHTFASMLIDAGANPKAIQAFMGHSKIQTTFDTYGHLMPGSHDQVRERLDAYLESVPGGTSAGAEVPTRA
jgi:integrase